MNRRILEFSKTEHFLFSQWRRGLSDHELHYVLGRADVSPSGKHVLCVLPSFLERVLKLEKGKTCLVLVIHGRNLITIYWCDDPNYLFRKTEKPSFQILY
jgi:hypothetical protein